MSDNFPNAVYIPTGLAGDNDFIRISGYCYRKVDSGTVSAGRQMTNFVTGFDDCLDCNTCNCPKTINFIFDLPGPRVEFQFFSKFSTFPIFDPTALRTLRDVVWPQELVLHASISSLDEINLSL